MDAFLTGPMPLSPLARHDYIEEIGRATFHRIVLNPSTMLLT